MSTSASERPYKGKATGRSWQLLPEEIVRLIATHYLLQIGPDQYTPTQWGGRKLWYNKMVFTTVRDALALEKNVMSICPEWHRAVTTHLFWQTALSVVDPLDIMTQYRIIRPKNASSNSSARFYSPHQHFRNVLAWSCLVCRVNLPQTSAGFTNVKTTTHSLHFGPISLCELHDATRRHWCSLCLREPPYSRSGQPTTRDSDLAAALGCFENDDEEVWPGVDTTCRKCRIEGLIGRCHTPLDRITLAVPSLEPPDWETRQSIEIFVDQGDGTISEVIIMAREKHWLRTYTKYAELCEHALAARQSAGVGPEGEDDDPEALLVENATQVRDLALQDWARHRILDGYWVSPADIWYRHTVPGKPLHVRAVHPFPWNNEPSSRPTPGEGDAMEVGSDGDGDGDDDIHPMKSTVEGEVPPTYHMCEKAYGAHMKQMREVLIPAMRNIVRKVVVECSFPTEKGYVDPAIKIARMSLEEVVAILREEEGVWYDGVDWSERKRNEMHARQKQRAELLLDDSRKDDDLVSTASISSSEGSSKSAPLSDATSPVLSTSTLQTTPSPPPSGEAETLEQKYPSKALAIALPPVRDPPQVLGSVPYVPITIEGLPSYSIEALKSAWRDACAQLYICGCSICERMKAEQAASNPTYHTIAPATPLSPANFYPDSTVKVHDQKDYDEDGEAEMDYDALELSDYYEDDEDEEFEDGEDDRRYVANKRHAYSSSPEADVPTPPPHSVSVVSGTTSRHSANVRKRGLDEVDEVEEDSSDRDSLLSRDPREIGGGTPPKRARTRESVVSLEDESVDTSASPTITTPYFSSSVAEPRSSSPFTPSRQRKRRSEELEDSIVNSSPMSSKRVKANSGAPTTLYSTDERAARGDPSGPAKGAPAIDDSHRPLGARRGSDVDWRIEGNVNAMDGERGKRELSVSPPELTDVSVFDSVSALNSRVQRDPV